MIKSQSISILIAIIIVLLSLFSISILNKAKLINLKTNLKEINKIKFFNSFAESLLKNIVYSSALSSSYELSNDMMDKYIWEDYPLSCGITPPSPEYVNDRLRMRILSSLSEFETLIKIMNILKVFYPIEISYNFDNIKIEFPFGEKEIIDGKEDEGFPIIVKNVIISVKFPFGESIENYSFYLYINRTRMYYLYRKIYNWLEDGGYKNIIDEYKDSLFTCRYGYKIHIKRDYLCESSQKKVCSGEIHKITIKKVITKSRKCVPQDEVDIIKEKNKEVEKECKGTYTSYECVINPETCKVTYKTKDTLYNRNIRICRFIVSGSGGSSSGENSGGSSSGSCVWVDIEKCGDKVISDTPTGTPCKKTINIGENIKLSCPGPIGCYDTSKIPAILEKIRKDLENEINSLFDSYVHCRVMLKYYKYNCKPSIIKKVIKDCGCETTSKADIEIEAVYLIQCTDDKYENYINGELKKISLKFELGIMGKTNCPSPKVRELNPNCCKIYKINGKKVCCSGIDGEGNCIKCEDDVNKNSIKSTISVICKT